MIIKKVVRIDEIAVQFVRDVNAFIMHRIGFGPFITSYEAKRWIVEIVESGVNERCLWTAVTGGYEKSMESHLYWLKFEPTEDPLINDFLTQIFDEFELAINGLIDQVIPRATWHIWTVTLMADFIFFEKGEDYRIVDWHRKNPTHKRG